MIRAAKGLMDTRSACVPSLPQGGLLVSPALDSRRSLLLSQSRSPSHSPHHCLSISSGGHRLRRAPNQHSAGGCPLRGCGRGGFLEVELPAGLLCRAAPPPRPPAPPPPSRTWDGSHGTFSSAHLLLCLSGNTRVSASTSTMTLPPCSTDVGQVPLVPGAHKRGSCRHFLPI